MSFSQRVKQREKRKTTKLTSAHALKVELSLYTVQCLYIINCCAVAIAHVCSRLFTNIYTVCECMLAVAAINFYIFLALIHKLITLTKTL